MNRNRFIGSAFIMFWAASVWAQAPGSSPSAAAPLGTPVSGIVECGEGYTSHELYDMKVTAVETIRGAAAEQRLGAEGRAVAAQQAGTEHMLVRVRFEYRARGTPGLCVHELSPEQFTAYSASGEDYPAASVKPPNPELRRPMKSGDIFEGWLAFTVSKDDRAPLMSYSVDSGGAVQHGESKWFALKESR